MAELGTSTVKLVPPIIMQPGDHASDVILRFFDLCGWDRETKIDPAKIRTSRVIADEMHSLMCSMAPSSERGEIGMLYVHSGPGMDNDLSGRQVRLLEGWVQPADKTGTDKA